VERGRLPLVQMYSYAEQFAVYQRLVAEWGVWIIIGKAFTPIPFKIAAIATGSRRWTRGPS